MKTAPASPPRLLTIQDISCVGQCSATVALPLVSACGVECAVLPSAVLSNHTGGFPSWTFRDLTGELPLVEAKWNELGLRFDAFLTGYVCEPQIDPILSILRTCTAAALAADIVCAAIQATPPDHWHGVAFEQTIPLLATRLASA